MPGKGSRKKRVRSLRHDPLEKQIMDSMETGTLKPQKKQKKEKAEKVEEDSDAFVNDKISSRIMKQVHEQQAEIEAEFPALGSGGKSAPVTSAWGKLPTPAIPKGRIAAPTLDADDSDEEEEELVNADLEEEIEDIEITEDQERDLSMFMPSSTSNRRTLADIIMDKINQQQDGAVEDQKESADAMGGSSLDPKVIDVYTQVGKYLGNYTSGKVPKAFKIIPSLRDWEEILHLTNPENWSAQAMFVATRLFASNLNPKMAQRFYNLVLLPRVREDIAKMKRLNYHLYASVKKSIYKPAAFFRGVLLPLALDECTVREALIMSSILSKNSIPAIHASVALLKLSEMEYSGPVTLFMKTLLNKKYSLPYRVIDGLVKYFVGFEADEREMPVVWHQNLLTFVQRYKSNLTPEQKSGLKSLLRKQQHKGITSEVRRELFAQAPSITMDV